jgi:hypothetical protein
MADKLLLHANQRIDKVDFDYAATGYTDAVIAQDHVEVLQGRSSYALHGFRIELADQTASPGELTIHNGAYIDASGKLVTNEESVEASQTITLLGANSTFYLEITFQESPTTLDDKAFWDPTFDNGAGTLKGKEYVQEVNTRTSTIWTIKSPISNTSFTASNDDGSVNVPLAILRTDSLGHITAAVNPGLVTSQYSTVLEEDADAGDTLIKVLDATSLLESTDHILIGTENKILDSIDRENGFVTLTTGLASAKPHGTIVQNVSGPEYIIPRTTAHVEYISTTSTHPDKLKRFFAGDESRGEAIIASPFAAGQRTDLQIESVKDHVDFLAQQLREMKVGSSAPYPSDISKIRYYDYAGSIQGSKTVSFTIGTGIGSSVGDFNGETQVPFQQAIAAAIAAGLTSVVIFVKHGTYSISTPIASSIPVTIVGESTSGSDLNVILAGSGVTTAMFSPTTALNLYNVYLDKATVSTTGVIDLKEGSTRVGLYNVKTSTLFTPLISAIVADGEYDLTLDASQCFLSCGGTVGAIIFFGPTADEGTLRGALRDSIIEVRGPTTHFTNFTRLNTFNAEGINFTSFANGSFATSDAWDLHIYASRFSFTAALATGGVLVSQPTSGGLIRSTVSDCEVVYSSAGDNAKAFFVKYALDSTIRSNVIEMNFNATATGVGIAGIEVFGSTTTTCSNFLVDSTSVYLSVGKSGRGIVIHDCITLKNTIRGCSVFGGNVGFSLYNLFLPAVPAYYGRISLLIESNTYTGGNYEPGSAFVSHHFGIQVNDFPEIVDLSIINNNIIGLRGYTNATGIEVLRQAASTTTISSKLNIQSNGVKKIGRPTADETAAAYGIRIDTLNAYVSTLVIGNQVDTIYGTTAIGIFAPSAAPLLGENLSVNDNTLAGIVAVSAGPGTVTGIRVGQPGRCLLVSNNTLAYLSDSAPSSTIDGILVTANDAVVQGNQITDSRVSIAGSECGIRFANSSGYSIKGNSIRGSSRGIVCDNTTASLVRGSISNNMIGPAPVRAPSIGILVSVFSVNANDILIDGNVIEDITGTATQGIAVTSTVAGSGVIISNNLVKESKTTLPNTGSGISINNMSNALVTGNNVYGSTAGHAGAGLVISRAGLSLTNSNVATLSSNLFQWNLGALTGVGAAGQGDIRIIGSSVVNISSNNILGKNLGAVNLAISIAGPTNGVFVIGNYFQGTDGFGNQITPPGGSVSNIGANPANNAMFP